MVQLYRPLVGGRMLGQASSPSMFGDLSPEQQDSLIRSVASTVTSGFQSLGNFFDTPGGVVRDLLALQNPLPGIFDPNERISGRGLLQHYGLVGPNRPGLDLGDVAGFGTEVVLDPFAWASGGASAASRAGQVARRAGLMDDIVKLASKKAGRVVGKREAMMTSTLDDLLGVGPTVQRSAADTAAQGLGLHLDDLLGQTLGGAVGLGLPFRDPSFVLGTGARAQQVARKLDRAGEALRYGNIPGTSFSPGSALARLFDVRTGDAASRVGQQFVMPSLYEGRRGARAAARGVVGESAIDLVRHGGDLADTSLEASRAMRRIFEGVDAAPDELAPMVERVGGALGQMVPTAKEWGLRLDELIDPTINYFPRHWSTIVKRGRTSQIGSTFDPAQLGRQFDLRRLGEGTDTFIQLTQDPLVRDAIQQGASVDDIASIIGSQYGDQVPELFARPVKRGRKATEIKIANQRQALAKRLSKMTPDELAAGGFGNHPIADLSARLTNGLEAQDVGKRILSNLADADLMKMAYRTAKTNEHVPLSKVLRDLKYHVGNHQEGALRKFLELRGVEPTARNAKLWAKMPVPRDLADDLRRYYTAFTGPEAVGEIVGALDSVTNLWKAGVTTPWPAFHVRNLISGQFQNWTAGMFSGQSVAEAHSVLRGGAGESLADIPAIAKMMQESGGTAADALRRLSHQHDIVGRFQGDALQPIGGRVPATGAGFEDVLGSMPGGVGGTRPFDFGNVGRKFAGMTDDTTLNPLRAQVRGVGGAMESTLGPLAAGHDAGYYIESMNRLSPFIDQLRKGIDPAEAARRVKAAQIDYSRAAHTTFQNDVVTRMFPFSRFTMGVVPFTLRQLWEHPGGKLAQTVRAVNSIGGENPLLPDYMAGSAAVPLGQLPDGSDRYLTGFGIMAEQPLGFLGGGASGALLEGMSQMNPLAKFLAETATGETFFQRGPTGGRELTDLDPTIGRLLANVTGQEQPVSTPQWFEHAVSNSPLQRLFTSARQLTDPRKGALGKAANLLTGFRVSDVSPAAQDAVLRERLNEVMRAMGGRSFVRAYIPEEEREQMSVEDQVRALQLQALMNELAQRAKARKLEKQATAGR